MRKSTRALAHSLQYFCMGAVLADPLKKPPAVHLLIKNQPGRPRFVEGLGVTKLVLIGGMRQWNQDGRLAGRGQLRDCPRSGAANYHIRALERSRHVIDERKK